MQLGNEKVDALLRNTRSIFIEDLHNKIQNFKGLVSSHNCETADLLVKDLLRLFHSIGGTASTLKLPGLSELGRKGELKINALIGLGKDIDGETVKSALPILDTIESELADVQYAQNTKNSPSESVKSFNVHNRGKILLIDDDVAMLKLLESAFSVEGYDVFICDDSLAAMEAIDEIKPELLILDIMMPSCDGYELLEKIKSSHRCSDMHIVLLSSLNSTEDRIKGMKLGIDDYITKPFVVQEIVLRIEMILRRSNKYREKLVKDTLTGAGTRYYFNERINEEIERFKRGGSVFSLAFVDLDKFKNINDNYGHQTGDFLLHKFVETASETLRKCDTVFRYGGEEFIVILPDTDEQQAYKAIDRLRDVFSKQVVSFNGHAFTCTFSGGVIQARDEFETADRLVKAADAAMYYSKECGRNKITKYSSIVMKEKARKKLLIIDDESAMLKLLNVKLLEAGFDVITAGDGKSAIKLINELHVDAVILDLILPDVDGFEVCQAIRKNASARDTKIIILSKRKDEIDIAKGFMYGADDYITKPFSMSELEARVINVLDN